MNPDTNSRGWYANSFSHLKHIASQLTETISPSLFWRLKVQRLRHHREYEMQIAPFLCDRRKISLDIGASSGPYSVSVCDHSANCIAFEPRPAQAARMREMVTAAGLRIEVESVALSDSAGLAQLRILTKALGRSTIESANALEDPDGNPEVSIRVPKVRLDDYNLRDVGFIKIDVEGHEFAVLRGAEKTLRTSMPNLLVEIEERHRAGTLGDVTVFLTDLGYEGFFILDGEVLPLARFDKSVHQNPANAGGWTDGWEERHGVYVNNFFFLPASHGGVLNAAVSAIDLRRASNTKAA